MANKFVVPADASGKYVISSVPSANILRIDIVDVDLVLRTTDGNLFVLPGAGMGSMSEDPPSVVFADRDIRSDVLMESLGTSLRVADDAASLTTADSSNQGFELERKDEIKKAVDLAVKQAKAEFEKQREEEQKEDKKQDQQREQVAALPVNTESSVEAMVEKAEKITENLKTSDYDYTPPQEFQPPPGATASPPGQPAPISLTPVVTLFMGNVVGTTYDTASSPGISIAYGGGGAVGSEASEQIGPRNVQQFSTASIPGTGGDDLIYAQGLALGNANPAVDATMYAKEFNLNVAGYFITLNDIVFSGVPATVTIVGATDNGGGRWTLSSEYVTSNQSFKMIYDTSATGTFDITVDVTGDTTRGSVFNSQQTFRFQYIAATSINQVIDQSLVYEDNGRLKEIYVLPTLDQPNLITAGAGNDSIYGGRNNDTITGGDGDNLVVAKEGNDTVTLGNGNNNVNAGAGNNIVTTGSGDDTIVAADGDNVIDGGNGSNSLTLGDGYNEIITGTGNDTITLASGGGSIVAGGGNNTIQAGAGNYNFTAGSGDDSIVAGVGNHTVSGGDGNNSITLGAGTNSIIVGSGNDTLVGSSGNDFFSAGLGTNTITGNGGTDTIDYSAITTTGITLSLATGLATGTGLADTISGIVNVTATGLDDTVTGSTSGNLIYGGDGNDSIVGNGGSDSLYGGSGNDTLTGNTGNDLIYGGAGNNTISGGSGGVDSLYGGSGNDLFVANSAGTIYNGTNGAALTSGERNTIDYSTATSGMNINLEVGFGLGGLAQGANYAMTPTAGINSINGIIGGTGHDSITGSDGDDNLNGGTANSGNDTLVGGLGNNTLQGGAGGTEAYGMGLGNDTIIASTSSYDRIYYNSSGAGIVINLTNAAQTYVNSLGVTRTVAAYSGDNFGVTAADASSFSVGDYFTPVSGTSTSIERIEGSGRADLIFVGSDSIEYYNIWGGGSDTLYGGSGNVSFWGFEQNDYFYGGSGNDTFFFSNGRDRADGGSGFNVIRTQSWYSGPFNTVVYLDAAADTNNNSIADYIDRGVTTLTDVSNGVTYTGFEYGWGNTTSGANAALLRNFDHIEGREGNDYFVGNDNANQINAHRGFNTVFGRGGDDIITAIDGSNIIDGGAGTDLVNFQYSNNSISGSLASASGNYGDGVHVFLSDAAFLGASDKAVYWSGVSASFQARTGQIGANLYSTITNVENINGSDSNDVLYGDSSANIIYGNNGTDIIAGNGGVDSLYGGNGNDTFRVTASDLANVSIFNGGANTDTLYSPGWSFTAGTISAADSKYVSIETVDARDSVAGGTYGLSAADVRALADNNNASVVTLNLDSGDVFTASATGANHVDQAGSGNNFVYSYYSSPGTSNLIATLNVNYGA
jgi:Ca2+-binding RTX toxin-like protein